MKSDRRVLVAVILCVSVFGSFAPQPSAKDTKSQQQRPDDDGPVVARVTVRDAEELDRLVALGLDLLETREGDDLFVLTTPAHVKRLREEGWQVKVDKGQTALVRRQRPELRSAGAKGGKADDAGVGASAVQGGYLTVPEMRAFLDARAAEHPRLARTFVYGSSWERVSRGQEHELFGIELTNSERTGAKPTFFLMAAIHARELTTSELALRFVDHLLTNYGTDADATWLLDEHRVVVVPVANPDGRRLAEQGLYQRKNTHAVGDAPCAEPVTMFSQPGIDLNRNHDFKWGTVDKPTIDPCTEPYPGTHAASEPETDALQNLVRSYFPDQRGPLDTDAAPLSTTGLLITLHSYGDLVMWPWGHTSGVAPNGTALALIGGKFAGYNGYTAQQANKLYPSSGKTDEWAYGELGIPAYVFEVGLSSGECGGFMPPYSCLDGGEGGRFWQRNLPAFLYAARIAREPYRLVQGPTVESVTLTPNANGTSFELRAQIDDVRNGNLRVAAAEYYIDTPPWRGGTPVAMSAADGRFSTAVETVKATVAARAGRHTIYVRGRDANNNWGPVRAVFEPDEPCAYTVGPTGASFGWGGGSGTVGVDVTAGSNCGWSAAVSGGADWLTVTSGASGTGDGNVTYDVTPHYGSGTRSATLTVAGKTFTVTQYSARLVAFWLNNSHVYGGSPSDGVVMLDAAAPEGGMVVQLTSSNPSAASVPASVTVAAGQTSAPFAVTTQPVAATTNVTLTAAQGGVTQTA
ncbi:MAG TPA: M14 family zinc carboxypeptidase, partial [Pyrinomonadaceae bacterium]